LTKDVVSVRKRVVEQVIIIIINRVPLGDLNMDG
jgi:hypothetical protein